MKEVAVGQQQVHRRCVAPTCHLMKRGLVLAWLNERKFKWPSEGRGL